MASLPHISVAGAIATGTHGSGDKSGSLAAAVAALELVTATGDLVRIRRGDAGFDGVVVGLGVFGVVTRVSVDIEPSFNIRQDAFSGLPWATLLADFDQIMSAATSVSLITLWSKETVDRLWLKVRLPDGVPAAVAAMRWGVAAAPYPNISASSGPDARLTEFGVPGPWSERLPHFQSAGTPGVVDQIQSEYMLPRRMATRALAALRAIAEDVDRYLIVTEIRTVMQDNLWLSPCYGDDRVAIHFTWKKEPGPVDAITSEIEEMLLPLGARPHWGKVIHARAGQIAHLYPRLPDFRDLARRYDPNGKFRNEFLDTHVFG
jgi:alditol oxidase